jgi:hypothetical protein
MLACVTPYIRRLFIYLAYSVLVYQSAHKSAGEDFTYQIGFDVLIRGRPTVEPFPDAPSIRKIFQLSCLDYEAEGHHSELNA